MTENDLHNEDSSSYWQANLRLLFFLLSIWFVVSYGCGIIFAEDLNAFMLPGTSFPLGFWFAQQGAIYIFVLLIFFYAFKMNKLERQYGVAED